MSKVIYNKMIDDDYFMLKTDTKVDKVYPGQFFMLRAWDLYPTLSRPISIYDVCEDGLVFLIESRGIGSKLLKNLKEGDEIKVFGPYGNHFEYENIREISLVAGGVGSAPFYYLSKCLKKSNPDVKIDLYIGLRENQKLEKCFEDLGVNLIVKKGGFITDYVDFDKKLIYTCGPDIMMYKLKDLAEKNACKIYLSLDKRMGCGLGACLSCTCKTVNGNSRTCKDGPIYKGSDILE